MLPGKIKVKKNALLENVEYTIFLIANKEPVVTQYFVREVGRRTSTVGLTHLLRITTWCERCRDCGLCWSVLERRRWAVKWAQKWTERRTHSTFNIQPVEPFEFSKPHEWTKWKRRFERFCQASSLISYGFCPLEVVGEIQQINHSQRHGWKHPRVSRTSDGQTHFIFFPSCDNKFFAFWYSC